MKKIKFLAMMMAAVTVLFSTSSCSKDDDDPVIPAAETMAGSYTGDWSVTVMGSESSETATFTITKKTDSTVSVTFPGTSGSSTMVLPSITIDDVAVTKTTVDGQEVAKAEVASLAGTITVSGTEKSYNFTNLTILSTGSKVSITYTLQYGKMPMPMTCMFTGTK